MKKILLLKFGVFKNGFVSQGAPGVYKYQTRFSHIYRLLNEIDDCSIFCTIFNSTAQSFKNETPP